MASDSLVPNPALRGPVPHISACRMRFRVSYTSQGPGTHRTRSHRAQPSTGRWWPPNRCVRSNSSAIRTAMSMISSSRSSFTRGTGVATLALSGSWRRSLSGSGWRALRGSGTQLTSGRRPHPRAATSLQDQSARNCGAHAADGGTAACSAVSDGISHAAGFQQPLACHGPHEDQEGPNTGPSAALEAGAAWRQERERCTSMVPPCWNLRAHSSLHRVAFGPSGPPPVANEPRRARPGKV